jgi:molybdopterin converting factor subunit 1
MDQLTVRAPAAAGATEAEPAGARLRVLFFSLLRERVGTAALELDVPAGATGGDLLDLLARQYPAVAPLRPVVRLAVNAYYAAESVVLQDGDEVALITPVSGG